MPQGSSKLCTVPPSSIVPSTPATGDFSQLTLQLLRDSRGNGRDQRGQQGLRTAPGSRGMPQI
eukprot:9007105-Karenia_brevis.AAC.1